MKQTAKLSLFKAPADPERLGRSVWERYLHRGDKRLTPDSAVCELHFEQSFIVRDYVHIINGTELRIPRGTPTLTPDAVPTILPNVAPHLSKRLPPERNVRKRSEEDAVPRKRRRLSTTDEPAVRNRSPSSVSDVLNEPTANDDALATIAALRDVKLPNRYTAEAVQPNSPSVGVIKKMLEFLNKREDHTDKKQFLNQSTAEGLRITLTSTLELLDNLHKKVGHTYLITSQLSQDKSENFFGIVRMSSGCNTHPTPQQFLLAVNCLSFYNLARSVTGGNSTADTISSLLSIEDSELTGKKKLMDTVNSHLNKQAPANESTSGNSAEHSYNVRRSDSRLICHIAGYVAKRCVLPSSCPACTDCLLLSAQDGRRMPAAEFIKHIDLGGLHYPSLELLKFISRLEDVFTNCFSGRKLHSESVMDVLHMIHHASPLQVGCEIHTKSLTARIVGFYVTMRLHFFVKGENKSNLLRKRNSAKHLKLSRLN
ncbi:hypothetical protein HPB51_019599 [Rhipicephalus microplus]|uniref:THAP-type domain-containing protein n=1 Tax=Rhipicephalus microplus TaxID=6941 RepID=A0A9J6EP29_RHIMP|nr:hypothetical protein HPB51_019599 [Rhipicephalus microplus]